MSWDHMNMGDVTVINYWHEILDYRIYSLHQWCPIQKAWFSFQQAEDTPEATPESTEN